MADRLVEETERFLGVDPNKPLTLEERRVIENAMRKQEGLDPLPEGTSLVTGALPIPIEGQFTERPTKGQRLKKARADKKTKTAPRPKGITREQEQAGGPAGSINIAGVDDLDAMSLQRKAAERIAVNDLDGAQKLLDLASQASKLREGFRESFAPEALGLDLIQSANRQAAGLSPGNLPLTESGVFRKPDVREPADVATRREARALQLLGFKQKGDIAKKGAQFEREKFEHTKKQDVFKALQSIKDLQIKQAALDAKGTKNTEGDIDSLGKLATLAKDINSATSTLNEEDKAAANLTINQMINNITLRLGKAGKLNQRVP